MTSEPASPGGWTPPASAPADEPAWRRPSPEDAATMDEAPAEFSPPAGDTSGPVPRREGLRATLAVLAVTAVVLSGLGVLAWWQHHQRQTTPVIAAPPPVYDTPTLAPSAPPGPPVYRVPGDLCQQADFTALRPTFNQIGNLSPENEDSGGPVKVAQCDGTTGNELVQGDFSFRTSVYADPQVARQEFEAGQQGSPSGTKVATLTSTGQAAYVASGHTGQTVEIYDGNLRIRLSWTATDGHAQPPAGTTQALVNVCESTMRLLHDD
jgi:hypothetical protein